MDKETCTCSIAHQLQYKELILSSLSKNGSMFTGLNRAPGAPVIGQKPTGIPPVTAEIARDLLRMGRSPTADNISKSTGNMPDVKLGRPKQQLEYLARVQGLKIQFTDFPKVSVHKCLSVVQQNSSCSGHYVSQ